MNSKPQIGGSKSLYIRCLILGLKNKIPLKIVNPSLSEDGQLAEKFVESLGARLINAEGEVTLIPPITFANQIKVECGDSGFLLRLTMSVLSFLNVDASITGSERLLKRPIENLIEALRLSGCEWKRVGNSFQKKGIIELDELCIPTQETSQFLSAVLIGSVFSQKKIQLNFETLLISKQYFQMTLSLFKTFGIHFEETGTSITIFKTEKTVIEKIEIEDDASSLSILALASILTKKKKSFSVPLNPIQKDFDFFTIIKDFGIHVHRTDSQIEITTPKYLKACVINLAYYPDLFPVLCLIALFAEGKTILNGAAHLKFKESNRIESMGQNLQKLGSQITFLEDGLEIVGIQNPTPSLLNTYRDHRVEMVFKILSHIYPQVKLEETGDYIKSFYNFNNFLGDV